jgi:recombination protein RecA
MVGTSFARDPKDPDDRRILGIFINQFRDKIGGFSPVGTPQTTPGGNAKNYSFYQQVDVKRDEWIEEKVPGKDLKVRVGQTIKIKTVKNKQAPPQQVASVDFYFRDAPLLGFSRGEYDRVKEVLTLGLVYDLIVRKGAYFSYGDERWQGRDNMLQAFREQPDLLDALDSDVRQIALQGQGGREITDEGLARAETAGKRTVKKRTVADDQTHVHMGGVLEPEERSRH